MSHLSPCEVCARHVRASDVRCPFCGAAVTAQAAPPMPAERLSRAALFAFGAAVLGSACIRSEPVANPPNAASPDRPATQRGVSESPAQERASQGVVSPPPPPGAIAAYGAPPPPPEPPEPRDGGRAQPTHRPSGSVSTRYGAPPRPDGP